MFASEVGSVKRKGDIAPCSEELLGERSWLEQKRADETMLWASLEARAVMPRPAYSPLAPL